MKTLDEAAADRNKEPGHVLNNLAGILPPDSYLAPTNDFVPFTKEDCEQSVTRRFETIVRRHPYQVAIKTKGQSVTYDELNRAVNRLASAILAARGSNPEAVGLLLKDPVLMITAMLAALKAGKFYVILDLAYPKDRNAYLLENSGATLIVSDNENVFLAEEISQKKQRLINLKNLEAGLSDQNPGLSISPDAFSYIMYTSGSTGNPKGVVDSQRNTLHNVHCYTNKIHISSKDRLTLLHSFSFRSSEYNLYGALLNGAALCPFDVKQEGVRALANWIVDQQITVYHSIANLFRELTENLARRDDLFALRVATLSAATVTKTDLELCNRYLSPACSLLHFMGATETMTVSWRFIDWSADFPGAVLPLGWAPEDKEVLLLDDQLKEVGPNGIGEIAVRSRYISLGYWKNPEITKTNFLPDPKGTVQRIYLTGDLGRKTPEHGLFHCGRKDFQIKIRGHRVEPSEIEAALATHPGIKESVVIGAKDTAENTRLIAYFIPAKTEPALTVSELHDHLRHKLPDFMIPAQFIKLEALPLNPHGKLDRMALPTQDQSRPELSETVIPPGTAIEEMLVTMWADILKLETVGINDNFFELSGDSLLAAQAISRASATFQVEIPFHALFETPTISGLAKAVEKASNDHGKSLVPRITAVPRASRREHLSLRGNQAPPKERKE